MGGCGGLLGKRRALAAIVLDPHRVRQVEAASLSSRSRGPFYLSVPFRRASFRREVLTQLHDNGREQSAMFRDSSKPLK